MVVKNNSCLSLRYLYTTMRTLNKWFIFNSTNNTLRQKYSTSGDIASCRSRSFFFWFKIQTAVRTFDFTKSWYAYTLFFKSYLLIFCFNLLVTRFTITFTIKFILGAVIKRFSTSITNIPIPSFIFIKTFSTNIAIFVVAVVILFNIFSTYIASMINFLRTFITIILSFVLSFFSQQPKFFSTFVTIPFPFKID